MNTCIDTFNTIVSLNWILRLLGLSNVTRDKNQLISCQSLLKNSVGFVIITLSTILLTVLKIYFNVKTKWQDFRFIDSLPFIFIIEYIQYAINFFIAYNLKNEKLDYLIFYNHVDSALEPDFEAIRSFVNKIVASFIVIFVLSSSGDFSMWYINNKLDWKDHTFFTIDFVYYFISAIIGLDVVSHVVQIEYRMKALVKHIKDHYTTLQVLDNGGRNAPTDSGGDRNAPKDLRLGQLRTVSTKNSGLQALCKGYLLLMEQVDYINRIFGVRILVFCFFLFIHLIHTLNIIIRAAQWNLEIKFLILLPVMSAVFRIVGYIGAVIIIMYRCEQAYKQCNAAIKTIDFTLVLEKICPEERKALTDLRVLIMTRPIRIHAANVFTCNYPLLLSIVSAVSTYTIILYQNME